MILSRLARSGRGGLLLLAIGRLRRTCPVAHSSGYGGFWALTRHADVAAAASDPVTFISSVRAVVLSDPRGLRRPPLNYDAPAHTPYRRALDRTLQRARIERLEPRLRAHAARELTPLIEALRERGGGRGLFTGCAAGDSAGAVVVEVADR